MIFNAKKTFCMCIKYNVNSAGNVIIPEVVLNGKILHHVSDHQHLSVLANDLFVDDVKRDK